MLDRTIAPASHAIEGFDLIRPQQVDFKNGVKLFIVDGGDQDLVRVEWIFDNVFSKGEQSLLNTVASGMLLEGTTRYTHAQIVDKVDFFGAYLIPEYAYDHSALTLFSLNKHVVNVLPIVKSILTESNYPQRELNTYTRNGKQRLQVSLQKNDFVARRKFNTAIFGSNRYGIVPEVDEYDRVTREVLLDLHKRQFIPKNCTIIIAGKVTPGLVGLLREHFDEGWQNDTAKAMETPPVFMEPDDKLIIEERPSSLQSAIRLGNKTIRREHPDFPGLQVANILLGGFFGSRLMANIREDKGYTYGIGSGIVSLKYDAFLTISTQVGIEVTKATMREIEREINRLRDELATPEEIDLVKNYILGSLLGSLENVFSHADKFKNSYFSNLGLDYYHYYIDVVQRIDAHEIQRLSRQYLDYDNMVKVVVGKNE